MGAKSVAQLADMGNPSTHPAPVVPTGHRSLTQAVRLTNQSARE